MKKFLLWMTVLVLSLGLPSCAARTALSPADELLGLGEQYLLDLDYEQALAQFLGVIELEPVNPRGYTGAARAYVGLGDIDSAVDILEVGLDHTDDAGIEEMLEELYIELEAVWQEEQALSAQEETPPEFLLAENLTGAEPFDLSDLSEWGFPHGMQRDDLSKSLENEQGVGAFFSQDGIITQVGGPSTYRHIREMGPPTAPRGIRQGDHITDVLAAYALHNQAVLDIAQSLDYQRMVQGVDYPIYRYEHEDMVQEALLVGGSVGNGPVSSFSLYYHINRADGSRIAHMSISFTPEGTMSSVNVSYY